MAITSAYRDVLTRTRAHSPQWGNAQRHAAGVIRALEALDVHGGLILDYGAGTGAFGRSVAALSSHRFSVVNYEPSVPSWSELSLGPFDAVVCTHVLEHVEPELLEATIAELGARARVLIYVEVPHGPANKELDDGRDAHLTQWPRDRWEAWLNFPGFKRRRGVAANPINSLWYFEREVIK